MNSQTHGRSSKTASLLFHYYARKSNEMFPIPVNAQIIHKHDTDVYILAGNKINETRLHILSIKCIRMQTTVSDCTNNFQSSYISLEHISDVNTFMRLEDNSRIQNLLRGLATDENYIDDQTNLTCTIKAIYDGSKDTYQDPLSKTSLFCMIVLSSCVILVFGLCIVWIIAVHYRRFKERRMKKKQRKALARHVQQILDKLPIIFFNSNNKDNDYIDDDPMCAICLESFINNEKIRKLVCSHYFHIACIDPWILSHQNCPLCNQNILNNSVTSISASITTTNNELNDRESNTQDIINNHSIIES